MKEEQFEMVAKTLYGLEDVLAAELRQLGASDVKTGRRMASFTGGNTLLYKANFWCRTALRILKPIVEFKANNADEVYQEVKKIDWKKYLTIDKTFSIDAVVYSETFNHSKFVAYRTKDAIADYFTDRCGRRPSVRLNNPDLCISIHISNDNCSVSIDSSGESMHRRGYRTSQTEAPLNEVLAAGMILQTGWRGESNFVDPMCGSGTLLIEAAMIAMNIPPGIFRKEFAFEKWPDFDAELFREISSDDSEERDFNFKCYGSDNSPMAISKAQKNIKNAGLSKYVDLKILPIQQYIDAPQPGILVTNPPYGERLAPDDLLELYAVIGERLKHAFQGYNAWILSYREECFDQISLHPKRRIKLMNGELECEYRCYELFSGKNKDFKAAAASKMKLSKVNPKSSESEETASDDDVKSSEDDVIISEETAAEVVTPKKRAAPSKKKVDYEVVTSGDDEKPSKDDVIITRDDVKSSKKTAKSTKDNKKSTKDNVKSSEDDEISDEDDVKPSDEDELIPDEDIITTKDNLITSDDEARISDDDVIYSNDNVIISDDDELLSEEDDFISEDDKILSDIAEISSEEDKPVSPSVKSTTASKKRKNKEI